MTTYIVTRVREELAADRSHRHIEGAIARERCALHHAQMVTSINNGDTWKAKAGGYEAIITKMTYCPNDSCMAKQHQDTAGQHRTGQTSKLCPRADAGTSALCRRWPGALTGRPHAHIADPITNTR
jgi:hypothetical protein